MSFSKRNDINKSLPLQVDSISPELRNALWNPIYSTWVERDNCYKDLPLIRDDLVLLGVPLDTFKKTMHAVTSMHIKNQFNIVAWNTIYDLIEKIASRPKPKAEKELSTDSFKEEINDTLEKHNAAYRLQNTMVVRIVNPNALESIERIQNNRSIVDTVQTELKKAIQKLSERETANPHRFNESAEASIHALEAYFINKTGEATLSKAIGQCKKQKKIADSLSKALEKLYAFANEQLRHAIKPQNSQVILEHSDALFILNLASALINYLENPGQLFPLADQLIPPESKQA